MSAEYKSYSRDMDMILYSPYFAALYGRNHGRNYSALRYLDGKDSLTRRLAEKYDANKKLIKALLYARELGRPPLNDAGERFMKEELGATPLQASVIIAKQIGLSSKLVSELSQLDAPLTMEGKIVNYVNSNFDRMSDMDLDRIELLLDEATNFKDNNFEINEDCDWIEEENIPIQTDSPEQEQQMSAIRNEIALLGTGKDAILGLQMLSDGDFYISELPKAFASFLKEKIGTQTQF